MAEAHYPDLTGKLAVVTGGGRGIGWATVRRLRSEGCRVVILDRQVSEATVEAADEDGFSAVAGDPHTEFAPCDVTNWAEVADVVGRLGRRETPDILVCAAGIVRSASAEDMTAEAWRDVIDVNLTGLFAVCQAVGRLMLAAGRGSIVTIGSMSGTISNVPQKQASYNASKAGVIHLTRTLAGEWADRGVRVNAVSPGYIATELTAALMSAEPDLAAQWTSRTPLGRVGQPSEIAEVILFLASEVSSFMTGSDVAADGGYTVW